VKGSFWGCQANNIKVIRGDYPLLNSLNWCFSLASYFLMGWQSVKIGRMQNRVSMEMIRNDASGNSPFA
jgi:hypothetical protein